MYSLSNTKIKKIPFFFFKINTKQHCDGWVLKLWGQPTQESNFLTSLNTTTGQFENNEKKREVKTEYKHDK